MPSGAGVGSAIGFLRAPFGYEVVRSLYQRFARFDLHAVNQLLAAMEREAMDVVAVGSGAAPVSQTRTAFMRYVGQGHEIPVPLPACVLGEGDVAAIRAGYDEAYARFYDRPVPGSDVEIMSFSVLVSTDVQANPSPQGGSGSTSPLPVGGEGWVTGRAQQVRDPATGMVADWPVLDRAALAPGTQVAGPAIIAEDETSTLIGPGWRAEVDAWGYIELLRERA